MLELKKGVDILSAVGGIKDIESAKKLINEKMDSVSLKKMEGIKNEEAIMKIANAISMIGADKIFVNTGSEEDKESVRKMSIEKGEERPLAMKNHTIHYDLPEDQARLVDRTFYIINEDEKISSMAKKVIRSEAHEFVEKHMKNIGKGKTLLIGFFSRGPIGAKASLPALEITTSTYVMHSANILYRNAYEKFDEEIDRAKYLLTNVHSEGLNRAEDLPNARIYMDRSWLTTFSMNCTYAGNTLLLKKGNHRFAVDLATYYQVEEALSEHMFITGLTGPDGRKTYFAGAAPSGCGKTTTAMVGTDFIGDDLAQLWIDDNGSLRGINPEKGIFGIVKDVNHEGDPYLMKSLREEGAEVIWSNVLIDENNVPFWEGIDEEVPEKGFNFQGEWYKGKKDANGKEIPISHPNSRCTLDCTSIGNFNEEAAEDPAGVEIKVITYSGRDSDTMPPVTVAKSMNGGVVIGASILSAATATEIGVSGVRRQPWANQPFIPGALADYMDAQFKFFNSSKLNNKPIMSGLNYFLTEGARGGEGTKLLGEKKDVKVWLGWLELYANGDVEAIETPIGFVPKYEDLKKLFAGISKEYTKELYDKHFAIYADNIIKRIELQEEAYGKEENIPQALYEIYKKQKEELSELKKQHGSIIPIDQLA